jgi:hypothetical protein
MHSTSSMRGKIARIAQGQRGRGWGFMQPTSWLSSSPRGSPQLFPLRPARRRAFQKRRPRRKQKLCGGWLGCAGGGWAFRGGQLQPRDAAARAHVWVLLGESAGCTPEIETWPLPPPSSGCGSLDSSHPLQPRPGNACEHQAGQGGGGKGKRKQR